MVVDANSWSDESSEHASLKSYINKLIDFKQGGKIPFSDDLETKPTNREYYMAFLNKLPQVLTQIEAENDHEQLTPIFN